MYFIGFFYSISSGRNFLLLHDVDMVVNSP